MFTLARRVFSSHCHRRPRFFFVLTNRKLGGCAAPPIIIPYCGWGLQARAYPGPGHGALGSGPRAPGPWAPLAGKLRRILVGVQCGNVALVSRLPSGYTWGFSMTHLLMAKTFVFPSAAGALGLRPRAPKEKTQMAGGWLPTPRQGNKTLISGGWKKLIGPLARAHRWAG